VRGQLLRFTRSGWRELPAAHIDDYLDMLLS
jgi:hypothetical protein